MLATPSPSASFFTTGMRSRSSEKRSFKPVSCMASTSARGRWVKALWEWPPSARRIIQQQVGFLFDGSLHD
jgi:hypothetical protein